MRIEWLRTALRNLDEEASYIAADDLAAAREVVRRILEAIATLREQLDIGRPGRVPGTRELVVSRTRYLVPYRVRGRVVQVLRVFHTSRRPRVRSDSSVAGSRPGSGTRYPSCVAAFRNLKVALPRAVTSRSASARNSANASVRPTLTTVGTNSSHWPLRTVPM